MDQLLPRVARIEADVAVLKQDVTVLKQDVTVLKQDVAVLKQDVTGLKQDVAGLREHVIELKEDMAGLKGTVGVMMINQVRFDGHLQELRGSLDSKFKWMVTTMIAFGTALLAAMAEGFHWLR